MRLVASSITYWLRSGVPSVLVSLPPVVGKPANGRGVRNCPDKWFMRLAPSKLGFTRRIVQHLDAKGPLYLSPAGFNANLKLLKRAFEKGRKVQFSAISEHDMTWEQFLDSTWAFFSQVKADTEAEMQELQRHIQQTVAQYRETF